MDAISETGAGQFELSEDQRAIREMTAAFAADRVAPYALDWDRERYFPANIIRETGPLGFGGIYVREDVGGSGLGRLDAVLIFEALAAACPAFAAFISIHNMATWMIDSFGDEAQRQRFGQRSASERVNGRLKEFFGGWTVRVRGAAKVMCHLMFGIVAITALSLWQRLC